MNEIKSKSQQKRDAEALQAFGVILVGLSQHTLDELPLTPLLRQSISDAKTLKSHGAIKRQAMWIGKLLRSEGAESIVLAYEQILARDSNKTEAFHTVEAWRSRLIADEPQALTALIAQYPVIEVQRIRQLIKKAQAEQQRGLPVGAGRLLFRYLRSFIA